MRQHRTNRRILAILLPAMAAGFLGFFIAACSGSSGIVMPVGGNSKGDDDDDDERVDLFGDDRAVLFDDNDVEGINSLGGVDGADVTYPKLTFHGTGPSVYDGKSYSSTSDIIVELDKFNLQINQTFLRVIVPDRQSDSDAETNKKLGLTTYVRPTKDEMQALMEDGFKNAGYVIFAKSVTTPQATFTFDKPLPAFSWPAPMVRYKELTEGGTPQWSATVNGQYQAIVTVPKESSSGDMFSIKLSLSLPSDRGGNLYGSFPIPKRGIYHIDTVQRLVLRINSHSQGYNQKYEKTGTTDLDNRLCTTEKDGETKTFDPCN